MNHSSEFIQDCFLVFDKVGDNKIALSQVGDLARALGLNPTNMDIKRVTPKNSEPETRINMDQFMPIYHDLEKVTFSSSRLKIFNTVIYYFLRVSYLILEESPSHTHIHDIFAPNFPCCYTF